LYKTEGESGSSGTFEYCLYDGQGSVRHRSDTAGALISYSYSGGSCDTFAYDAYGQRVDPLKDTVNEGLFYTGEQWDNSAQMYYLRSRYYDPLNGRFNQMDSFAGNNEDPQSLHKYLYCHANPVNAIDPSGKFEIGLNLMTLITIVIIAIVYVSWRQVNYRYYRGLDNPRISNRDVDNRIRGFETAKTILDEELGVEPALNFAQLTTQLENRGVYQVGEAGVGVIGRGERLPAGERMIVEYFESRLWNASHPEANKHPGRLMGGDGTAEYAGLWGAAESKRMGIIIGELKQEANRRNIPGY